MYNTIYEHSFIDNLSFFIIGVIFYLLSPLDVGFFSIITLVY